MGIGLSVKDMATDFIESGVEPHWAGRLAEWLATVLPPGAEERYERLTAGDGPEDGRGAEDDHDLERQPRRCRQLRRGGPA